MDFGEITAFWIRRVFRVYPAYLASLALMLALRLIVFRPGGLTGLADGWSTTWLQPITWAMVRDYIALVGRHPSGINGVVWTLIIEMRIALVYPFVIMVLRRKSHGGALGVMAASLVLLALGKLSGGLMVETNSLPLFIMGGLVAKYRSHIVRGLRALRPPILVALGRGSLFNPVLRACVQRN